MAKNETGIAITIKAWLPTGKTLDEQYAALTLVKTAHETGDYAPLLAAAQIDAVMTDQKTRRVDDKSEPEPEPAATDDAMAERASMTETDGTVTEPAVRRNALSIPEGFYAVRDENGVATGKVLPNPTPDPAPPEAEHPMSDAIKRERKAKAA